MKRALITRKIPAIAKKILKKKFEVTERPFLTKKELREALQTYDVILSTIADIFDKKTLSYATKTEVISNYAVGVDNIDVDFAISKGIAVYNLPHIVTNSTADLTFAIFLALIRKICEATEYVRKGKWRSWKADSFLGEELCGKVFGIIGFGRIGKAVAKRALAFDLKVVFFNRSKVEIGEFGRDIRQVSKEEVFEESDYISLHVPLTDQTRYMIDLTAMKKMKKKPILINMARGAVVKSDDLVLALRQKRLRGVALDVTDPEPLPRSHPLLSCDNCLITPHLGTATKECREEMAKKAAENVLKHYE